METIFTDEKLPKWKVLRNSLLSTHFPMRRPKFMSLDSYKLVHVWVDENEKPIKKSAGKRDEESFFIFTSEQLTGQAEKVCTLEEVQSELTISFSKSTRIQLKTMMLGELVRELASEPKVASIKVNPVLVDLGSENGYMYFCEEVLFAPRFDKTTKKFLLTDPDIAKALLAVSEQDQSRFGIELVFYMLSGRDLPEEKEERQLILRKKLEEMSFILPRVPMKRGSGSFLTVILNLDNEIEESAFIREYNLFDKYSDPLFVTSSFKLMTGQLEEIHYNGDQIDTIFTPMIQWQESKNSRRVNS